MESVIFASNRSAPEKMPVVPLRDSVVFPSMTVPLTILDQKTTTAVEKALHDDRVFAALFVKDPSEKTPDKEALARIGTMCAVFRLKHEEDGSMKIIAHGFNKIRVTEFTEEQDVLIVRVETLEETWESTDEIQALMRSVSELCQTIVRRMPMIPDEMRAAVASVEDPHRLAYMACTLTHMEPGDLQSLLEMESADDKLRKVLSALTHEMDLIELGSKIQQSVQQEMDKTQREHFLRQQLKAIHRELGEADPHSADTSELRERVEKTELPEHVRPVVARELGRLDRISPASPEYPLVRDYADWLLDYPWSVRTEDKSDLNEAQRVLDEDHYDLKRIKERIIEYLAVRQRASNLRSPILCFVGPPGVGKTSLGRSIARALGRKFVRLSLGGMRDEAEIRGHRRTYIGALPGAIVQQIKRAGTCNPVFMLDEIDKVGSDWRGDPSSALLEVLDPEQNNAFRDHYMELDLDLSGVLFITTANTIDRVQPALRDRMEEIRLSGYITEEKVEIARRYLVPDLLKQHGLENGSLLLGDEAIAYVVSAYTREAGVRNLERILGTICRKVAVRQSQGGASSVNITPELIREFLGPEQHQPELAMRSSKPGVATGMAWTESGGDILFIEAVAIPGTEKVLLTGQLGEVMQESAKTAISCIRSRCEALGISPKQFQDQGLHVHVPAGAVPKDGPSAGITIATAVASILSGRPVRHDVAMTGEVTLTGDVLPVGGIKEKILAAKRAGIKKVILPKRSRPFFDEIDEPLREGIDATYVSDIDEVLRAALVNSRDKP
ncbi:MAG: endopeptidase La [bacterium]